MLNVKLLGICFFAFLHWCKWKHQALWFYSLSHVVVLKASWTGAALTHARVSVRRGLWLGESGQTVLPSHEPDCLPLVLITSLCKDSSGRKLAISYTGSRQNTSSLKSCQLTLAPVLLSHPLFNQGRRNIRAWHSALQVGNDLLPCYQRAL